MDMHILGTRGSTLISGNDYRDYGWHTQCVAFPLEDRLVIFDAGTGIIKAKTLVGDYKRADIFITHYHLDHVSSLLMFQPFHAKGFEINIYAPDLAGRKAKDIIESMFQPPYWPLTMDTLNSKVTINSMQHLETVDIGQCKVQAHMLCHPGGSIGFKITEGDKSIAYVFDHEENLGEIDITDFISDIDILICDAPYTKSEYEIVKGFGHSTQETIMALAKRCNIKKTVVAHHSPFKTDKDLDVLRETHTAINFAREGDVYTV